MASGYGIKGGQGRCFPHWQEFLACYAQADELKDCVLPKADYMECLHHANEIRRTQQIKGEMMRQEHLQGVTPKTQKEMMGDVPRLNIVK